MKNTMLIITSILVLSFWGCEEEPDTTPPDISIASPVDGAIVSDTITIKTVVADNDGINNVEFYLDGDLLATVSEEPFQTEWNTSESSNGKHNLQCKAVDNSDNETLSESIQVTVANALFTANFTNDWLCADCGEGIIFISDMDGNVLADATWTGNASFEIEAPEDLTEFPERISVTTVTNGRLTTNLNIPVGSSWTWGDYYLSPDYDNPINVEFDFQNIPDHAGYVISSPWNSGVSSYGSIITPYQFTFYESSVDIYLKLNTMGIGLSMLDLVDEEKVDDPSNYHIYDQSDYPDRTRQGGDTVDDATVIDDLPYYNTGTTEGYTDDYDEVCPYTDSTSPDVVYSFTPATDILVEINLCGEGTYYDTKVYVYEGEAGTLATTVDGLDACNDDYCQNSHTNYSSYLPGVMMTGGTTYYIVVDGWLGNAGVYEIEVVEDLVAPSTKYIWIEGVTAGSYQADLSNLNDTESKTIDLQGSPYRFSQYLYGYPDRGSRYTGHYMLDYDYAFNTTVTSVSVYYPPSTFSDFRTSLYFYDSDNTSEYWYQEVYGGIPNSFDKIDADFDFISTTPTNFQISTTSSNFDQIRSVWTHSGGLYYWYFYGPNDLTSYSLPNLPNSVLNKYPDLEMQLFELLYTSLIDHSELNSYYEILDIIFNSPDLFYNVVNDLRSRVKYYDSGRSSNIEWDFEIEDEYFEMQHHR